MEQLGDSEPSAHPGRIRCCFQVAVCRLSSAAAFWAIAYGIDLEYIQFHRDADSVSPCGLDILGTLVLLISARWSSFNQSRPAELPTPSSRFNQVLRLNILTRWHNRLSRTSKRLLGLTSSASSACSSSRACFKSQPTFANYVIEVCSVDGSVLSRSTKQESQANQTSHHQLRTPNFESSSTSWPPPQPLSPSSRSTADQTMFAS